MSFLSDLPSIFALSPSSTQTKSKTGFKISKIQRTITYIASHETDPPKNQVITTDRTNLLLRYLNYQEKKRRRHEEVNIITTTTNLMLQEQRDESDDESQQSPQRKRVKYSQSVREYSHKTENSPEELTRTSSGTHSQIPSSSLSSSNVSHTGMSRRSRHRRQNQNQQ